MHHYAMGARGSQPLDDVQQQYPEASSTARFPWLGNGLH
uniref:Uncharacterized protein n=1 Tax=Arundo donax TaxID=35708 RepID=A0A0A9GXL6_ARUDO